MGYWVNTTYINHPDSNAVRDALKELFLEEKMHFTKAPAQRKRKVVEPMQYEPALRNDLWGVAVFPGAPSWTIIQTAPVELLAETSPKTSRMRLIDLCTRLGVPAFQLNVYDGSDSVLFEVLGDGTTAVSGDRVEEPDEEEWNGELIGASWHGLKLKEELYTPRFQLLPLQPVIEGMDRHEERAEIVRHHLGGKNAEYCDNFVSMDTLISHKPFDAEGGEALYFKWKGATRQRYKATDDWRKTGY